VFIFFYRRRPPIELCLFFLRERTTQKEKKTPGAHEGSAPSRFVPFLRHQRRLSLAAAEVA
jgi:hypothetical protein